MNIFSLIKNSRSYDFFKKRKIEFEYKKIKNINKLYFKSGIFVLQITVDTIKIDTDNIPSILEKNELVDYKELKKLYYTELKSIDKKIDYIYDIGYFPSDNIISVREKIANTIRMLEDINEDEIRNRIYAYISK